MVKVLIGQKEFFVPARVAELLLNIAERWERLASGSKTLRATLREHHIKLTVEEEL